MAVTPLRRQVLVAIVGVTGLCVLLFALPLAVAVDRLFRGEALAHLEDEATRIAALDPADPGSFRLPEDYVAGFYRADGSRVSGEGPEASALAGRASLGRIVEGAEGEDLAAAVPAGDRVVRVAVESEEVTERIHEAWTLLAAIAAGVLALAAGLAWVLGRRLARPLERLTDAAQALGAGDFSIRARPSGLREAEAAEQALEATARRLGRVLERERSFSSNVSHQLRTPLTGMLLGLEAALDRPDPRAAIGTALERGEHLQQIVDDLLRLTRDTPSVQDELEVAGLLAGIERRWRPAVEAGGRVLEFFAEDDLPPVTASPAAVRQILDVLIDNALDHGRGRITVAAADFGGALALDVTDEGDGPADPDRIFTRRASREGHGIGLALARSLAEAEGGRLVLRQTAPPVFGLLLPERNA